jgi:hypothetical protein
MTSYQLAKLWDEANNIFAMTGFKLMGTSIPPFKFPLFE